MKILGVWIHEDLNWNKNTKEICRRAYSRMSMLTKLKYVGVSTKDLLYMEVLQSIVQLCKIGVFRGPEAPP